MADNVPFQSGTLATPANTTVVATDDVAGLGGQVQLVKIVDATADGTNRGVITASGAFKIDGSLVTQPVSVVSLPLPANAATDRTTAAAPFSVELSDGAAFYTAAKTGQFPAALGAGGGVKVDGSGTALPISAASLPLPALAAQDHITAALPGSTRLSDGTSFYDAAKTGQLPTSLVGGRLDVSLGASPSILLVSNDELLFEMKKITSLMSILLMQFNVNAMDIEGVV